MAAHLPKRGGVPTTLRTLRYQRALHPTLLVTQIGVLAWAYTGVVGCWGCFVVDANPRPFAWGPPTIHADVRRYGNHPLFRFVLGWLLPPQMSFLKASHTPETREASIYKQVYQDISFPAAELDAGLTKSHELFDICEDPRRLL